MQSEIWLTAIHHILIPYGPVLCCAVRGSSESSDFHLAAGLWLLFAEHSFSQSSGVISMLLDWSSGYSCLIFCFQGVDFPAIPLKQLFLLAEGNKASLQDILCWEYKG